MRIVLDTASLISAIRSPTGGAAELLRLIGLGRFTLLLDYKLASEYRDVALRPEHLLAAGLTSQAVDQILCDLIDFAEPVEIIDKVRPLSPDPDDDMVLDLAINGRADVLVTPNRRHFTKPAALFDILVLTPAELLGKLRREE